jgi:ribosomal protein L40E
MFASLSRPRYHPPDDRPRGGAPERGAIGGARGMITCRVCGAENEAEAVFCGVCGSRLGPPEATAGETPAPPQTSSAEATPDDEVVVPSRKARGPASPSPDAAESVAPALSVPVTPVSTDTTALDLSGITCAVCGTRNDPAREFCRKCASPLRPSTTVVKSNDTLKFLGTFVLTATLGVSVVLGGAALLRPQAAQASPVSLTSGDRPEVDVGLTADAPKPLEALPASATIQLASFKAQTTTPGDRVQPPWWNASVPRVPAISQFDGGPLQAVNCVMASGAMLARLGFGIVTTGSQLRALQDDQDGATNYADLKAALARGWAVSLFTGDLSAIQLRALLWAGAGVEVGIVYGVLPIPDRVQESFTGNHSIYIDAFRQAGSDGPAAYYVMDPIGHTWAGYRGEWLPAADIEAAAEAHSAGKISAAWTFAGGVVPADHRVLPPSAYPGAGPGESPAPTGTGGPGSTSGPIVDPLPLGDLPLATDPATGDPPPNTPTFPDLHFVKDAYVMDPSVGLPTCSAVPTPAGCPTGILGIIDVGGAALLSPSSPPASSIDLLYANLISPGTYQIVFTAPAGSDSNLFLWGTSGALQQADVQAGFIGGQAVSVATVTLDTSTSYSFVATASGSGGQAISSVGTVTAQP